MSIYVSEEQFASIRSAVIRSNLHLIILTAISFCLSFFIEIYHCLLFSLSCYAVKSHFNSSLDKSYRFPAAIHLYLPIFIAIIVFLSCIIYVFDYFAGAGAALIVLVAELVAVIALCFLIKYISKKFFDYKISYYRILASYHLYNYYSLMAKIIGKKKSMLCLILQISCFYSIAYSLLFSVTSAEDNFGLTPHPIKLFVFTGLFVPLLSFALFNLIEIIIFHRAKFPTSGLSFEYQKAHNWKFIMPVIISCFFGFFIASLPFVAHPFVKNCLGYSKYNQFMGKIIQYRTKHR